MSPCRSKARSPGSSEWPSPRFSAAKVRKREDQPGVEAAAWRSPNPAGVYAMALFQQGGHRVMIIFTTRCRRRSLFFTRHVEAPILSTTRSLLHCAARRIMCFSRCMSPGGGNACFLRQIAIPFLEQHSPWQRGVASSGMRGTIAGGLRGDYRLCGNRVQERAQAFLAASP